MLHIPSFELDTQVTVLINHPHKQNPSKHFLGFQTCKMSQIINFSFRSSEHFYKYLPHAIMKERTNF